MAPTPFCRIHKSIRRPALYFTQASAWFMVTVEQIYCFFMEMATLSICAEFIINAGWLVPMSIHQQFCHIQLQLQRTPSSFGRYISLRPQNVYDCRTNFFGNTSTTAGHGDALHPNQHPLDARSPICFLRQLDSQAHGIHTFTDLYHLER